MKVAILEAPLQRLGQEWCPCCVQLGGLDKETVINTEVRSQGWLQRVRIWERERMSELVLDKLLTERYWESQQLGENFKGVYYSSKNPSSSLPFPWRSSQKDFQNASLLVDCKTLPSEDLSLCWNWTSMFPERGILELYKPAWNHSIIY